MNRVKIVATLGPASSDESVIKALVEAGTNVFRLNLSHGAPADHRALVDRIRRVSKSLDVPVAILADIQGPKIRTGALKDHVPIELKDGTEVLLTSAQPLGEEGMISTTCQELIDSVKPGMMILIDDGNIEIQVKDKVDPRTLRCQVVQGGWLKERKGMNVPDTVLQIDALTEKDKADTLMSLELQVDFLALSFIQKPEDIQSLKNFIVQNGHTPPPIIAKIEKPQALDVIEEILALSDGLMVARGDLGVELSPERVPIVQKQLIEKANAAEKPVIVATQMLESMITNLHPNRAEVSDIANAVFDGCDAMMLSGETAVGEHPIETVRMMRKIIEEAEKNYLTYQHRPHEASSVVSPNFYHAIAHSASYAAMKADVKAIVVLSTSGSMAQRVSKLKPQREIIALTPDEKVYNRLALLWGVRALVIPFGPNTDETLSRGEKAILSHHLLEAGEKVVFCAGNTPFHGATNMLKIYRIGEN